MRMKAPVAVLSAACLGVLVPAANAGAPSIDPNGNFGMIDVGVSPPTASTKAKPHGAALEYHGFFGNRLTGARSIYDGTITLRLPKGLKTNGKLLAAKCALPATAADVGKDRCPAAAQFGTGTALLDARPALPNLIPATLKAFNGALKGGSPTIVVLGKATVGGSAVSSELDFVFKNAPQGPYGVALVSIPGPGSSPTTPAAYSFTAFNLLTKDKTFRRGGKLMHLVVPPSTCNGSWAFAQTNTTSDGTGSITATDTAPCTR
jgi:hypothetical protein